MALGAARHAGAGSWGDGAVQRDVALGSVFWPLLPVGLAYTAATLATSAAAKVVRP